MIFLGICALVGWVSDTQVHRIYGKQKHKGLIFDRLKGLQDFYYFCFSVTHIVWRVEQEGLPGSSLISASLLASAKGIIYSATFVAPHDSENTLMLSNQWSNLDPPKML